MIVLSTIAKHSFETAVQMACHVGCELLILAICDQKTANRKF